MVNPISASQDRKEDRWLRVITVLAFLPAFGLLLPYGIINAKPLPTVGIAAMFFSAAFSILVLGGGNHSTGVRACYDLFIAASIIAILIPSWIFLSETHESWWDKRQRLTILATYGTTPMLLNLYVSLVGISGEKFPKLTRFPITLHIFAALHTIYTNVHISWKAKSCPNCHHDIIRVFRSAAEQESGDKNTVQTSTRFYDDEERLPNEFQTSGFNTPRQSEETLASSIRISGVLLQSGCLGLRVGFGVTKMLLKTRTHARTLKDL